MELQWGDEPKKASSTSATGRKVVYRTDHKAPFKKGEIFSVADVQPYVWNELSVVNGRASDQLSRPDVATFVPVIIVQDRVYSGNPQGFRFIPSLEQVDAQNAVGAVRVTWKWPPHIQQAVIAIGSSLAENPLDSKGVTVVTRKDGEERGTHYYLWDTGKRITLVAASITDLDGRMVAGALHVVEGRAVERGEIEYEFIKVGGGVFSRNKVKSHTLRLRVRNAGPLSDLPPLLVCYKEGDAPANADDGVGGQASRRCHSPRTSTKSDTPRPWPQA